jgi:DDE superfamily endonuclease
MIRHCAKEVQNSEKWRNNDKVKQLKFTNHWIFDFLTRGNFRRRKITTGEKSRPTDEEVNRIMELGQTLYRTYLHSPNTTWNFDETAFTWAVGPTHMFVPVNQNRAQQLGVSNAKLRITASIAVSGEGKFAPLFLIIKHSVSSDARPDQRGMRVIPSLNCKQGFRQEDGWHLKTWTRELTTTNKKQVRVTATHYVHYLEHETTGHIITSQHKAWNDTIRMAMWTDLIMNGNHVDKTEGGRRLLWMDNCGCHKTEAIVALFEQLNIDIALLPPNMTDILQVLDLVVNGPIKAHIRNKRASRLLDAFKVYKETIKSESELAQRQSRSPQYPKFKAPKPSMEQGITDLIELFGNDFTSAKFKRGVVKSFTNTGEIPMSGQLTLGEPIKFMPYESKATSGYFQLSSNSSVINLCSPLAQKDNCEDGHVEELGDLVVALDDYLDSNDLSVENLEYDYDSENNDDDNDDDDDDDDDDDIIGEETENDN